MTWYDSIYGDGWKSIIVQYLVGMNSDLPAIICFNVHQDIFGMRHGECVQPSDPVAICLSYKGCGGLWNVKWIPLEDSSEGKGETAAWQDSEGFLTWSQRKLATKPHPGHTLHPIAKSC